MEILKGQFDSPLPRTALPNRTVKLSLLFESVIPLAAIEEQVVPIQVSEDQVAKAILSFPCGSAGGPDGLRPQHLKDIIGN